jgi:hypothetical protein
MTWPLLHGRRTIRINPEERSCGSLPANGPTRQGTSESEAEEAKEQSKILHIGENSHFGGYPADKSKLSKQCERAGENQREETPLIGWGGGRYLAPALAEGGHKAIGQQ